MEISRRPTIVETYEPPSARRERRVPEKQSAEKPRSGSPVQHEQGKSEQDNSVACSVLSADTVPSGEASIAMKRKDGRRGTDVL